MPSNMSQTRQQDLGSKPFPQVEKKAVDVARIHNPQDPSHAQAQLHHARERPRARSKQIAQAARRKQSRRQGDDARLRNDSRKTGHEIILLWYENEGAGYWQDWSRQQSGGVLLEWRKGEQMKWKNRSVTAKLRAQENRKKRHRCKRETKVAGRCARVQRESTRSCR